MAGVKLRQLGIPSLTAFAIACAIMLAAGVTAIADLCELSFAGFMNCVWFLKCLLLCYLVMHPLCRWLRKDWVAALVATVLVILIPGTETVNFNFMLPMFCLGMLCGNRREAIGRHRAFWLAGSLILSDARLGHRDSGLGQSGLDAVPPGPRHGGNDDLLPAGQAGL